MRPFLTSVCVLALSCSSQADVSASSVQYSQAALADQVDWNELPGGAAVSELHNRKTFAGYIPIEGTKFNVNTRCRLSMLAAHDVLPLHG